MFHYKPTREETNAIEAGFRALERISARNTLLRDTLDACFAHDKTENRKARKMGLSMASQLELKGRYCTYFWSGYKVPGILARTLVGMPMPMQQLHMLGASVGHADYVDIEAQSLGPAKLAHAAAFNRALDAI